MTITNNAHTDDTASDGDDLEVLRELITQSERTELADLRERVDALETMIANQANRATAVGEVLVDAIETTDASPEALGVALVPSIENAVSVSARTDSAVLAEALYPVLGPAMRNMIANLFSSDNGGKSFRVDQVLLIERGSGVLLAAAAGDGEPLNDADIVSGMLDAIRMFVQDAFETSDHDGLRDLRVGDTSVLVEWGPKAVLASVIHGIATDDYRESAATTLEAVHADYADEFDAFNGNVEPFNKVAPTLTDLHKSGSTTAGRKGSILAFAIAGFVVALVILVVVSLL